MMEYPERDEEAQKYIGKHFIASTGHHWDVKDRNKPLLCIGFDLPDLIILKYEKGDFRSIRDKELQWRFLCDWVEPYMPEPIFIDVEDLLDHWE